MSSAPSAAVITRALNGGGPLPTLAMSAVPWTPIGRAAAVGAVERPQWCRDREVIVHRRATATAAQQPARSRTRGRQRAVFYVGFTASISRGPPAAQGQSRPSGAKSGRPLKVPDLPFGHAAPFGGNSVRRTRWTFGRAIAFYTQSPAYLLAVSRERTPPTHLHRICEARRHPPRDNRFAPCRKLDHFGYRHQSHPVKDLRHVAGALDSNVGVMLRRSRRFAVRPQHAAPTVQ